ncbi:Gypsy retrotransposon integrase-like protein 1 [Senna tora]|uniref:Gypsy retrotransposon integrase-like protein 1 n=1 Tax=Senna tora TaxID=362788 RepID=A0A834XG05_9FABA|nr:Gypsy retrotransposon integrase-like protein 1 [Senna tora]
MRHPQEGKTILQDMHARWCRSDKVAMAFRRKTLIAGYYWPTITVDAEKLVKHCENCQRHGNYTHISANEQQIISSP